MTEDTEHRETQPQDVPVQGISGPQGPNPQETAGTGKAARGFALHDEDEDNLDLQHWRDLVAAVRVDGSWFRKQFPALLLVVAAVVVSVTRNYQAQQDILEVERLDKEAKDSKYRCLTRESELTQRIMQSEIERQLRARGDSTLVPGDEPPFLLTDK